MDKLFRFVKKVFSLVKAFGEKFSSLVKAGFLRVVEDTQYLIIIIFSYFISSPYGTNVYMIWYTLVLVQLCIKRVLQTKKSMKCLPLSFK